MIGVHFNVETQSTLCKTQNTKPNSDLPWMSGFWEHVPIRTSPVPIRTRTSPVPIRTSPVPIRTSPVLIRTSPAPIRTSPVPIRTSPVPIRTSVPHDSHDSQLESQDRWPSWPSRADMVTWRGHGAGPSRQASHTWVQDQWDLSPRDLEAPESSCTASEAGG